MKLFEFLEEGGYSPRKGLSQNFLTDPNILRKILKTAEVSSNDLVVEIGAGPGIITEALLETGAQVIAIEIDSRFAKELPRLNNGNLEVIESDILTVDFAQLLKGKSGAKIVANLPYHLTSPILGKIMPHQELFHSVTVVVQKEVADRMCGKVRTKNYSTLTLFLQFYAEVTARFEVSRNCFFPKPNVDSSVVRLDLHEPPQVDKEKLFKIIHTAFQQRRKMLRGSLSAIAPKPKIEKTLEEIGSHPGARPEELSLDQFLLLYKTL
ncbi:MAG: 16S rRNA (adenine(1518)-N(6)/adenine(1519)-N(6))-dimethyltransferase RsmA [Candidatus Algichlamydia australiensis]|nr:16S rRNA (adenine(1518)-N(6)/adenine(1519)-N(6))-dimethyltransferase RsmA [Chlamydiales bacterium]